MSACRAFVCLLVGLPVLAQAQAFVTVAIKPVRSTDRAGAGVQLRANGDFIARSVSVIQLLSNAYDVPVNPSPRLSAQVRSRIRRMIREVLADRFGLLMRVENKPMSVYALSLGSGGPKLLRSILGEKDCVSGAAREACHSFAGGVGHPLIASAVDMDDVAHYIGNWTDLPVVNRTGLSGLFTLRTEGWLPMRLPPPPPNAAPATNPFAGLPTIFAVLDKLGLERKRQEDVLPVYTVEGIERPRFG